MIASGRMELREKKGKCWRGRQEGREEMKCEKKGHGQGSGERKRGENKKKRRRGKGKRERERETENKAENRH